MLWWALARNEIRTCVRLNRTRFALGIIFTICAFYFVLVTLWHMQMSGVAPIYGVVSPRYLVNLLGNSLLTLFCVGILLLVFDLRYRDENTCIREVIDSKPIRSLEFFMGRLLGIFLLMGIWLLTIVILAVGWGMLSELFSIPFGEPIEPWSVASLLIMDVFPNFFFWGSFILFLGSAIRSRVLVLLLTLVCLCGSLWVSSRLSLELFSITQPVTGSVIFPSDLIPQFITFEILLQRIVPVMLGFGFLYWLSVLYPRNIKSTNVQYKKSAFSFTVGIVLFLGMFGGQVFEHLQVAHWRSVHNTQLDPNTFPNVDHIEGSVDVYPSRTVKLNLDITVSMPNDSTGEFALFSFNPGYRVQQLAIAGEVIKDFHFENGLLAIPRGYFSAEPVRLHLDAIGRPIAKFAYLDAVRRWSRIFGTEVRQLRYLGSENYIFRPSFVALMPGVKWYPVAGTAITKGYLGLRPKDFFTVDLKVSVPNGWLVAGPARRELLRDEKRTTYRFHTLSPISSLALVASRFEHASATVDGIKFEILYSGKHRRNFETLGPAGGVATVETARKLLDKIRSIGIEYPYSVFSLVEVPASLRVFGGGSDFNSVLGVPGFLMMPETTLPTLHLESLHDLMDLRRRKVHKWSNQEWMQKKIPKLQQYFGLELYVGNHLAHFSRTLLLDQTSVTGPNAEILNLILEQIVHLIVAEYDVSFDFELALDRDVVDLTHLEPLHIFKVFNRVFDIERVDLLLDLRDARMRALTSDDVLDVVESLSMTESALQITNTSVANRALRFRSLAISRLLLDLYGSEKIGSTVSELLRKYRGQNFSFEDFIVVAHSQGIDFEKQFLDMIHSTNLPGFTVTDVSQRLVMTDDEAEPVFEVTFALKNGEPVSGFCNVKPIADSFYLQHPRLAPANPIFVKGNQSIEVVIESGMPIIDIVVDPYLSLNRTALTLEVPQIQDLSIERRQSWEYPRVVSIREVSTVESEDNLSIVIDDLDNGFSVVNSSNRWNFDSTASYLVRRFWGVSADEMTRGLPTFQFNDYVVPEDTWERKTDSTAYGKYWKTLVLNRGGSGKTFAKFESVLPTEGSWRLEYFVPAGNFERIRSYFKQTSINYLGLTKGVADIDIHIGSDVFAKTFDASMVQPGWHTIAQFAVENLKVEVWLSNSSKHRVVFADAIRWTPMEQSK